MDDALTVSVLGYQEGRVPLDTVRNLVLLEAYHHLRRYRCRGEDDVSDFLLEFHGRIEGLLIRFRCRGLPFRHYLLRTLRWQWNTFRTDRSRGRQKDWLAVDAGLGSLEEEAVCEPDPTWTFRPNGPLSPGVRRRLVLLALKVSPYLAEEQLETISRETGTDLAWLQACQSRLKSATDCRRLRRELLGEKRGEFYYRRLLAEDDARKETDPDRRRIHEHRAAHYRGRLASLSARQKALSTSPTHRELAELLGMPKGSIDSSLHHLKKELVHVYNGLHDEDPPCHQQRPQEAGTPGHLSPVDPATPFGCRAGRLGP
ncbi:MAG TPA: hypothetical protein VMB23_02060 [Spirochaetia bacterium]|nr:hypothetical protein [Spirochaetia bacterium]